MLQNINKEQNIDRLTCDGELPTQISNRFSAVENIQIDEAILHVPNPI